MNNDPTRADNRESFFLIATLCLPPGQQRVKVRNLSQGGALIEGVEDATKGVTGWIEIRNIGQVGCVIAWANEGRAGLKFDHAIDPNAVRGVIPTPSATSPRDEGNSQGFPPKAFAAPATRQFYVVRWMKGATALAEDRFENLLDAKAYAKERLQINRIRKGVTSAEVSDIQGVGYFQFVA